jgi:hypothetical protein
MVEQRPLTTDPPDRPIHPWFGVTGHGVVGSMHDLTFLLRVNLKSRELKSSDGMVWGFLGLGVPGLRGSGLPCGWS